MDSWEGCLVNHLQQMNVISSDVFLILESSSAAPRGHCNYKLHPQKSTVVMYIYRHGLTLSLSLSLPIQIRLPQNLILDASSSTDDGGSDGLGYHWEEVAGPVGDSPHFTDNPVMMIDDLQPGRYKYRWVQIVRVAYGAKPSLTCRCRDTLGDDPLWACSPTYIYPYCSVY